MNLEHDSRKKNKMVVKELYNSDGLAVCTWSGNKDDYLDFTLPKGPVDMKSLAFTPIFVTGGWDQIDPITNDTWEINMEFPFGVKDGKEFTIRRGGFVRAYSQEDNVVRICIYPVDKDGKRDFAPIERLMVNKKSNSIMLPQKGLFVLVEGSVKIDKKKFTGLHIIRAKTKDLIIECDSQTRGIGTWRK